MREGGQFGGVAPQAIERVRDRPPARIAVGFLGGHGSEDTDGPAPGGRGGGAAYEVSYNDGVTDPQAGAIADDRLAVTTSGIAAAEIEDWAAVPAAGAVVAFRGVVRDHAEGRTGVHSITYEAYEDVARDRLGEIAAEARRRWPDLCRVALVHKVGLVELSEPSVLVAVSAPHRTEAFEAARWCIDTLKETLPVWKQEHAASGSGWARAATPVRPVGRQPSAGPPAGTD